MDTETKRILLFLLGCIPVRILLAVFAQNDIYAKYIAVLALIIGLGFWFIYLFDLRKTGGETFGNVIWWNSIRPIHGTLYLLAAWFLFNAEYMTGSRILFVDTFIGLVSFLNFHFLNAF